MLLDVIGGKDEYLQNKVLDHVLGGGDYSRPATVYIALYTALSEGGEGTEAALGGYTRVAVTNDDTAWPAASGGLKTNGVAFAWDPAIADVGTIVGAAVFDAATDGNRLYWGPFGLSYVWSSGQSFTIPVGACQFTEH